MYCCIASSTIQGQVHTKVFQCGKINVHLCLFLNLSCDGPSDFSQGVRRVCTEQKSFGKLSRSMGQHKAVTGRALGIMCLLLMMMFGRSSADLADETTTLLGLKQAWGNPEKLSSWSTNTNTCLWVGVMCDPATNTVVQVLKVSKSQLIGPIPETLGNLTSLRTLDLSSNELLGSIPETLGSLSNLQIIKLYGNFLNGSIPDTLGNLSNLQNLDLSSNHLRGSIPETLGSLSSLQVINIFHNLFDGSFPETLVNLSNLQTLDLSKNGFNGSIPETLGSLSNLQVIKLYSNLFDGSIPDTLGNLSNLQTLDLSSNKLGGSIPETLGSLSNLQVIDLSSNKLGESIPGTLGSLSSLQVIKLYDNLFDGSIPDTLGNLSNLLTLDLSNNNLGASIPETLGSLSSVQKIDLSSNDLQGPIPKEFGNLSMLQYLYLNNNSLTGPIPVQLTGLANLLELDLSSNELDGSIPETIENLTALQHLSLDNNFLSGGIPQNYTAIPNLTSLAAANNNLSGPIPTQFSSPAHLYSLDLHGNFFTGEVSDSLVALHPPFQTLYLGLYGYDFIKRINDNCLSGPFPQILHDKLDNSRFENNCFNGTICNSKCVRKVKGKANKSARNIFIPTGVAAGMLLVLSLGVVVIVCKRKSFIGTRTQRVPGSVQHYTLVEVIEATENYTKKIGEGGFSTVYKADFRDGTVAAVKHFNKKKPEESFLQEVEFLANLNHRYLVNLIGYCDDQGELMLMFDFMNRGSLFDTLHGSSSNPPLTWAERATILMNVARGIEYLHFGAPIHLIHRDIKSANILLSDSMGKTLIAKVADFGLGKKTILESYEAMPVLGSDEFQQTPHDTRIAGTPGYMDPEYMSASHLSPKVDVFSYGVVILELVTGRKAIFSHNQEATALVDWAKPYLEGNQIVTIMDPKLGNESIPEAQLVSVAGLVRRCIDNDSQNRPTIREVFETLSEIFRSESAEARALFSREQVSNTDRSRAAALRRMKDLFPTVSLEMFASRDSHSNHYCTQSEIPPRD